MRHIVPLALAVALTGCPEIGSEYGEPARTLGPLAAGAQILTIDQSRSELVAVTVDTGDVEVVQRFALSGEPGLLATVPDETAALIINRDTETLDKVTLPAGDVTRYELGAPFEALALSPDSSAAIAYFPPGSATTVFHNTNEVAFVDLRPEVLPEDAVLRRTLASLGGAPRSVHASPLVNGRRYAFVLSDEHVAILDLSDAVARERSVPLVSLNTGGTRTPRDVEFAVDRSGEDEQLWAAVTTDEGNSVYALNVFESVPTEDGEPAFDVRLTQLAGFSSGGDLDLVVLPDGRLVTVMVSPSQGTATVTQLSNGYSESVTLGSGVNRMGTYFEDNRPIAVIFRRGSSAFHILDVGAIGDKKDKAFRTRYAAGPIEDLAPIPGTPLFVAFHDSVEEAVSVIDADTDRITTFGRTGLVRDVILEQALGRMYLLTRLGSEDFLVSVQLDNLHPESSPVPGGADHLLLLPGAGTVATAADLPGGHLVLWPSDLTVEDAALAVPGYLLDGLLDRAAR